jgi:hypothetical protein
MRTRQDSVAAAFSHKLKRWRGPGMIKMFARRCSLWNARSLVRHFFPVLQLAIRRGIQVDTVSNFAEKNDDIQDPQSDTLMHLIEKSTAISEKGTRL